MTEEEKMHIVEIKAPRCAMEYVINEHPELFENLTIKSEIHPKVEEIKIEVPKKVRWGYMVSEEDANFEDRSN